MAEDKKPSDVRRIQATNPGATSGNTLDWLDFLKNAGGQLWNPQLSPDKMWDPAQSRVVPRPKDFGPATPPTVGNYGPATPLQNALKPAPTPKSLQQDISLPNENAYGPETPSANTMFGNDLDFVEQTQPHIGPINAQDPYNLWMNLPGRGGPGPAPMDEGAWGADGAFQGDSTISSVTPGGGGFMDSVKSGIGNMDAQDWLGVAGLGLGATGMYLNSKTQKDQFNQEMDFRRQGLAQQGAQFNAGLAQRQADTGLEATQLDPYKQQNSLASSALRRALLTDGPAQVQLGSSTPLDPGKANRAAVANQFLNDDALANAAGNFETARLHADPTGTPNNLGATGLGAAGQLADTNVAGTRQPMNQQALQSALMDGVNTQPQQKKSGGGFWKNLAKVAAIAAPIAAAPFTGGATLALIGAGSGAASGALNGGGWKGAALGAGLGAIPMGGSGSLAKGAVRPALGQGLKQAAKSSVKNPRTALAVMNALR